jgi:hypothetical protein
MESNHGTENGQFLKNPIPAAITVGEHSLLGRTFVIS